MADSDIFRAILLFEEPDALIVAQTLQLPMTHIARIARRGNDRGLPWKLVGGNFPIGDGFSYDRGGIVLGDVLAERCACRTDTIGIDERDASSVA